MLVGLWRSTRPEATNPRSSPTISNLLGSSRLLHLQIHLFTAEPHDVAHRASSTQHLANSAVFDVMLRYCGGGKVMLVDRDIPWAAHARIKYAFEVVFRCSLGCIGREIAIYAVTFPFRTRNRSCLAPILPLMPCPLPFWHQLGFETLYVLLLLHVQNIRLHWSNLRLP